MDQQHLFIIGAQKSGTTALHRFLGEHPQICMSEPKETNYFVKEMNTCYEDHFAQAEGKLWLGEAAPIYMLRCQEVASRIARCYPSGKIIILLRNPIERAYSQFHMLVQIGKASGEFASALTRAEGVRSIDDVKFDSLTGYPVDPVQTLLLYGNYVSQLQCYRRYFADHQFLLIRHEQLRDAHAETLAQVFRFLDVDPLKVQARSVHKREYPEIDQASWSRLRCIYEQEIDRLQLMLGWDLSVWKDCPRSV